MSFLPEAAHTENSSRRPSGCRSEKKMWRLEDLGEELDFKGTWSDGWVREEGSFSRGWSSEFINSQSIADTEQFFPLCTFLLLKDNHSQVLGGVSPKCFCYSVKRTSSICDNPNKAETSRSVCRHDVMNPYCWEYLLPEWG